MTTLTPLEIHFLEEFGGFWEAKWRQVCTTMASQIDPILKMPKKTVNTNRILLHNATRVGRNPMLRVDSLHASVFTCALACKLTCLHVYTLTCVHSLHAYVFTRSRACIFTCLHAYTLTCTRVHACTYVHAYTFTCTRKISPSSGPTFLPADRASVQRGVLYLFLRIAYTYIYIYDDH